MLQEAFRKFEEVAGAKLNVRKTEAMEIGINFPEWSGFAQKEAVKILGVTFTNGIKDTVARNWETIYRNVNALLWRNRPRIVNIKQKVTLINV